MRNTDTAPTSLTYAGGPFVGTVGDEFDVVRPQSAGGLPTAYEVTPALPAGFMFNPSNGHIGGTPTAVSAAASYTVKASNDVGAVESTISVEVKGALVAPSGLAYKDPTIGYVLNEAIDPNTATFLGTAPFTFAITPGLPAGLTLNPSTGAITGTATMEKAATPYTVTATNSKGSTTAALLLSVTAVTVAPDLTGYNGGMTSFQLPANAVSTLTPTKTGSTVTTWSITPENTLPAGLTFNQSTGVISGTPTVVTAAANFVIGATNSAGQDSVTIMIEVQLSSPATVTYAQEAFTFKTPGTAIPPITPTAIGGTGTKTFTATNLPPGFAINATTGVITGRPSFSAQTFMTTVRVNNGVGSEGTFALALTFSAPTFDHIVTVTLGGPNGTTTTIGPEMIGVTLGQCVSFQLVGTVAISSSWRIAVDSVAWAQILLPDGTVAAKEVCINSVPTGETIAYETFHNIGDEPRDAGTLTVLPQ